MDLNQLLLENNQNESYENNSENLSELQLSYVWLRENGFEDLIDQFEKNQTPIDICSVLKSAKDSDVLLLLRNVDILNNSLHKSPKSNSTINSRPSSVVGYGKFNQSSSMPPEIRRLSHHIPKHRNSNILMENNQYENTNSKLSNQSNSNTNINNKQNQQNISTNYKTSNRNRFSKFSNTQSIKEEFCCSTNSTNETRQLFISSPISFKQTNEDDLNQIKSVVLRRKKSNNFFPMINSRTVPKISFPNDTNATDSDSENSKFLSNNYRDYYELNSNSSCNDDLCNDSIDFGDSGRLNFRTGSFMTRYRRRSNKVSLQSSSGNLENERKAEKSGTKSKTPIELITGSINDELDPVLNSLKNDINSLDDFRKLINKHDDLHSRSSQKSLHLNTNELTNHNRLSSPSLTSGNDESSKENNTSDTNEKKENKDSEEKNGSSGVILANNQSTLNKSNNSNNTKGKKSSFKKSLSTRKRNHPFRWSSLARTTVSNQNQGSNEIQDLQLYRLSIVQLYHLKRIAMLKLTSMLQMHGCSSKYQFSWKFPKLLSVGSSKSTKISSANSMISAAEIVSSASPPVTSNSNNPIQDSSLNQLQSATPSSLVQFSLETPSSPSSPTPVSTSSSSSESVVFGKSLEYWQNRIGQPLPPVIYHAMKHIRVLGPNCDGIFRRAGGKARINELKKVINENPKFSDFSNWQPYDVADMLKSFFRSLPECLIPTKFTSSLVSAFIHLREDLWLEAIKCVIICMPDENRLVLQSVLYFLADLSKHCEINQMNSYNLSLCLAPSLFHTSNLFHQSASSSVSPIRLLKQHHHNQGPDPKELGEQKAIQVMLNLMIKHSVSIFKVSCDKFNLIPISFDLPISLNKLIYHTDVNSNQTGSNLWLQARLTNLVTEHHQKLKYWTIPKKEITKRVPSGMDIYYKKVNNNTDEQELNGITGMRLFNENNNNNIPLSVKNTNSSNTSRIPSLYTWKITTEIYYDPNELFDTILYKRHIWDPEVQEWSISEQIDTNIDLCEEQHLGCPPEPSRKINLLRGWKRYSSSQDNTNLIGCMVTQSVTLQPNRLAPHKTQPSQQTQPTVPPILPNIIRDDVILEQVSPPSAHINSPSFASPSSVSSLTGTSGCKCKLHWISRIDMRGYNHDWYYRHWYYVLIRRIVNLKQHLHLNPVIKGSM